MTGVERRTTAGRLLFVVAACALAFSLYAAGVPRDPPGFYIDESSIAYNAHLIAQTGADEYGTRWPLYFRAFGEYKNPVFIYLLAALFRLTGPSIFVARLLSASLGALAALLLGLLAARVSVRREAFAVVALSALLTPWLYEGSRLAFEAAIYPPAAALFLLAVWRASVKERWSGSDVLALAATLALLTYSYSVGRLLAPLLAAGLAFFFTRRNLARILQTWAAFALALTPLLVFDRRNPGALTGRFKLLTYVTPQSTLAADATEFARHYLADINPWRWLATGEWNVRDHVWGAGTLLAPTVALAACGLFLVLRKHRRESFWRFLLYALAVSVVPAALTTDDFPQLRLIAFPVFLNALTIPSVAWLLGGERDVARLRAASDEGLHDEPREASDDERAQPRTQKGRRAIIYALVAAMLLQGAYFQWLFHSRAQDRWYVFDARFARTILAPALATRQTVYLYDPPGRSGYVQALWHGALEGVGASHFARLASNDAPPPGALVISTEDGCSNCRLLARSINYILYAVPPTDLRANVSPLRPEALRAVVTSNELPRALNSGERRILNVIVKNVGGAAWPAVGGEGGRCAVVLRDRWLRADGSVAVSEDGEARILYDMEPGDAVGLALQVAAPDAPGDYVLDLDVAQEGAARFGSRGSKALSVRVTVGAP
ncbi:MAG TPA: glycosyltransferase family 39 protein [Pyrinomonadaceae bacterium]|nr:glycosyltransferase family 39 protein [Pyrinomonadaceae bacterium]